MSEVQTTTLEYDLAKKIVNQGSYTRMVVSPWFWPMSLAFLDHQMSAYARRWCDSLSMLCMKAPGTQPLPPRSIRLMAERGMEVPFFVTWMKRRRGRESFSEQDVDLRGCIGSLNPRPILSLGMIH